MKLNISNPATGCQKMIEVDDEKKLRPFMDLRMSQDVPGDSLGDEFKGYEFRITGGNDKQGFSMKQGVLKPGRVRLLLTEGASCYRARRKGERKRKSVRGCIVGPDLSVISLAIIKKGENELPGLTDKVVPRRLGPKRASNIRKLFNLSKDEDVRKHVIRREIQPKKEGKKPYTKAPKIQRLVTPQVLQRKRARQAVKAARWAKNKTDAAEYKKLVAKRLKEAADRRHEVQNRKRGIKDGKEAKDAKTAGTQVKDAKTAGQKLAGKAAKAVKDTKPKQEPKVKEAKPAVPKATTAKKPAKDAAAKKDAAKK